METDWTLEPGQRIVRRQLHAQYGGAWYGGIEPSSKSPNVFLFTSDTVGAQFGYAFDGWHEDGTFHYTGEGQLGDQLMNNGNRAVRDHLIDGRALRLFEKDGTDVIYVGEFEVPDESHILLDEALDSTKLALRSVFVFRLEPVGTALHDNHLGAPDLMYPTLVALEMANVSQYVAERVASEPVTALRAEAALVGRYVTWLHGTGVTSVMRHVIPTTAGHRMFTDVFIPDSGELIEAKSSSSRHHMRAALGQLLDYARYVEHAALAVLTPARPAPEMIELLSNYGVATIWETEKRGSFEAHRSVGSGRS